MEKSFDQKWGSKLLIGMIAVTVAYALFQLSPTGSAASESDSFFDKYYKEITDAIYEEANVTSTLTWDQVFTQDKGQNLYLLVYEEAKRAPANQALDNTAKYFGYSEKNLQAILDDTASLNTYKSYILASSEYDWVSADVNFNNSSEFTAIKTLIKDYYNEQLELEETRNELNSTALVNEMFVNDDTSDSGYDLISDLKIIESILFYSANDSGYGSGGGDFPDFPDEGDESGSGSGSGSNGSGSQGDDDDDDAAAAALGDDDDDDDDTIATEETAISEDGESASEEDELGDACFEDTQLAAALDNFLESDDYIDTNGDDDYDDDDTGGDDDDDDSGSDSGSNGSGDSNAGGGSDGDGGVNTSTLEAPEAADWSRGLPCNEFFCLEINFVSGEGEGDAVDYEETYNCIDCHFTYISEILDEVTSHDLAGGKVSGNMMEDATCKDDGLKVAPNLNVFAIASPILTPQNDDIVNVVSNIGEKFIEAVYTTYEEDTGNLESTVQEAARSARLTDSDKIVSYVESVQGDQMSAIEIAETAQELIYKDYYARLEDMEQFALSSQMNDMTTMFTSLDYEMDQMLSYFKSILTSLDSDIEILETILQKEYKDG